MSLHTSLGLLRAATTFIRHCWSPSTPQPEMYLVGNASTWAEPFKVIRADGDRAARSSVSGIKVVLLPPKKHGLSLQAAKGTANMESLEKPQVTVGKVTLSQAACVLRLAAALSPVSALEHMQLGCSVGTRLWAAVMDSD